MKPSQVLYAVTMALTVVNRVLIIYSNYQQMKEGEQMHAGMFSKLSPSEEAEARAWARSNYQLFSSINPTYHPVVQEECAKMNVEALNRKHGTMHSGDTTA